MRDVAKTFPPSVRAALKPVFLNEQINQVILFGSRAFGDHDERSDFDLAISAPDLSKRGMVEIWEGIELSDTLYKISISLLEAMPLSLKEQVISTGVVIYERTQA